MSHLQRGSCDISEETFFSFIGRNEAPRGAVKSEFPLRSNKLQSVLAKANEKDEVQGIIGKVSSDEGRRKC